MGVVQNSIKLCVRTSRPRFPKLCDNTGQSGGESKKGFLIINTKTVYNGGNEIRTWDRVAPDDLGQFLESRFQGANLYLFPCHSALNVPLVGQHYSGNIKYFNTTLEINFSRLDRNGGFKPYLFEKIEDKSVPIGYRVGRIISSGDINNEAWKTTKPIK